MKHDNKPLTLEELRQMEGQPVWIASINPLISQWAIVEYGDIDNVISFQDSKNELNLLVSWYGKTWLAYAYKPIDFDKWEPCGESCGKHCFNCDHDADEVWGDSDFCKDCKDCSKWESSYYRFCPKCGRPLTDTARQMLENRLAGHSNEQ